MKLILDTNFLINSVKYKVRIFEQLKGKKIFTLDKVVEELEKISKRKSKHAIYARVALKLLEREKIKILKSRKKKTDSALIDFSKKGYIILTQDKKLIKKLKGKYGFLRQRKIVVV